MKFGVFNSFMSPVSPPEEIAAFAKRVEEAGLDSIWVGEHVVLFDEMEFPYPGARDGRIPVPEGGGMLDVGSTFAFMASITSTIRFGSGICLVPQRNPVYTAKEFATLDYLTGGRIDFGIGVGWCKEEVLACGYGFEDRGARCDEFLEVIRALWTQPLAHFEGEHFQLAPCRMDPKPVQAGGIPTIVGGHGKPSLRRAARYGDGWYGYLLNPKLAREVLTALDAELAAVGRTREGFEIVVTPPYEVGDDTVREFADLGVDRLVLLTGSQRPERSARRIDEIARLAEAASQERAWR